MHRVCIPKTMSSWCRMRFCYRNFGFKFYKTSKVEALTALLHNSTIGCASGKETDQVKAEYTGNTKPGDKKDVSSPLPTTYSPNYVEAAWYDWWVKQGYFTPKEKTEGGCESVFVMVLPPPNVTGTLHLGHALTNSIQDAIVRWHQMQGRQVLWVPGTDHAGIATQVVVETRLWRERKQTRHDLGREKFLEEVWRWKHEKGEIITEQMKRLGSSLDWSRSYFTMDENLSRAVVEAFVRLHDEGLIYRNNRLVNWSCALRSAISDIEVDGVQLEGRTLFTVPGYDRKVPFGLLTSFAYHVHGTDEELVVATTRPETMLGDVGVAIHPDDSRYKHLHGQHVRHPFTRKLLPVVCDSFVDREFGTGAVKLTPGHDHNDFQVGERHNLDKPNIIDDSGNMVAVPDQFSGMKRFDARRHVVKALKELNLWRGEESHAMSVPVCSRSRDIVEPRLKDQWFLDCQEMARQAMQAVETGQLYLIPEYHKKIWMDWLSGIRDWCVSRQLWWGHRIPAYRLVNQGDVWVSGRTEQEARGKAAERLGISPHQVELQQDEDVLDTWFSSALVPFSVMGWPQQSDDLSRFYPSSLLETGSDILFFWVARMVMLGLNLTGQLPFNQVLLHGILRDSQGRKMSKSLGNVIDPMDVIHGCTLQSLQNQLLKSNLDPSEVKRASEGQKKDFPKGIPQCGADALRFTLCSYDFKAAEINMDITHAKSNKQFCNKIWQAYRFVQTNLGPDFTPVSKFEITKDHSATDKWILSRLSHMVRSCDTHFRVYDLHLATKSLHQFWLTEFCDLYLECVKPVFQQGTESEQAAARQVLYLCVETYLRAMSPFTPHLAEELYQRLPRRGDNWPESICVAPYPKQEEYCWVDEDADQTMSVVREVSHLSLAVRRDLNLTRLRASAYLVCTDPTLLLKLTNLKLSLQTLSRSQDLTLTSDSQSVPADCVCLPVNESCTLAVCIKDVVNAEAVLPSLRQKLSKLETELLRLFSSLPELQDEQIVKKTSDKIEHLKNHINKYNSLVSTLEKAS